MSLLEAQVPSHSLSNDLLEEAPDKCHGSIAVSGSLISGIEVVYTANWGIIWYLPPIKGTRKLH